MTRSAKVCVIGNDVKEKYFADVSAVGQTLKVQGLPLQIVGVEDKRGQLPGASFDRAIYIPVTLHQQLFGRAEGLQLHGKTAEREKFKDALEQTRVELRNKRKLSGSEEDTFGVVNTE